MPFEKALVSPPGFYEETRIETRFEVQAAKVDLWERVVELESRGDREIGIQEEP